MRLNGTFPPLKPYWTRTDIDNWTGTDIDHWTRTDIDNWARPIEENHISGPHIGALASLRDKNPYRTIEKGALLPPPSSPGSYLLSFNTLLACCLCLRSSFFSCANKNLGSGNIFLASTAAAILNR